MQTIFYRNIEIFETHRISEIDASIYIKHAWRDQDGQKKLVDLDYYEPGFPEGLAHHQEALETTILNHGYAIGAFNKEGMMVGFATLNKELFGKKSTYVLLDQLFISKPYRKKGIGKKLMDLCIDKARSFGANKIYICAGSSADTIFFYKALGCQEVVEINQALLERDPRDIHLEYIL
jgi:GNAT superfamily N-acetyltransferase